MKFIVEGVDGSGKTTLINNIIKTMPFMNFKVVHCTRETPNNLGYFWRLLNSRENIIFDRFHVGQFIYQNEEERIKNKWMSDRELEILEYYIAEKGIVCVYVNTPPDVCLYNCHHNGEDGHYTLDYIKDIQRKYEEFIERSSNDWRVFNNEYEHPFHASTVDFSKLPHIVAVDFDKCLADTEFPIIKDINMNLLDQLMYGKYKDSKKILWTTRTGDNLREAVEYLESFGFIPDAINDNIQEVKDVGLNPRKVYANIYLDDSAVQHYYKKNMYLRSNDCRYPDL